MSNWLDGKDVKSENLASICSYFGVSIEDLSNSDAPEQTKKPAGEIPDELKDTDYSKLNDQNKDLIKAMIATLYKQQSGE